MGRLVGNDGKQDKGLLRLFVAIDMPKPVQTEVKRIQKTLQKLDLFDGTYVNPEHAHVTLQFIGYVEPVAVVPIKKLLESVEFKPIEATLGRVGVFGTKEIAKVIWLDVVSEKLMALAHRIEEVLSMGTLERKRPFVSHMTLARVEKVADMQRLYEDLGAITPEPISFTISEFILKQSTLTQEGPVYVDLKRYGHDWM